MPGLKFSSAASPGAGALAALALFAFASFAPALWNGFVWDDEAITENALLSEPGGLYRIWFDPAANVQEEHYWPLTYTVLWAARRLWGVAPAGYHSLNIALHAFNAWLLLRILARFRHRAPEMAALVFLLHPMKVESVAWAIELKDVLSGATYGLAVLAFFAPGRTAAARIAGASGFFSLALASKTSVITLPATLALLSWIDPEDPGQGAPFRRRILNAAGRTAPLFALGAAYAAWDLHWVRSREAGLEVEAYGPAGFERPAIALNALVFYAGKFLWPGALMVNYPKWEIGMERWAMGLAGLAAALAAMIRSGPGFRVLAANYGITALPVLGFVDFSFMRYSFVADRFQYLSGASLAAIAAAALAPAFMRPAKIRFTRTARRADTFRIEGTARPSRVPAALTAALGLLTFVNTLKYRDVETLFTDALRKHEAHWVSHYNLANALQRKGDLDRAREHYTRALALNPDNPSLYVNLGNTFAKAKRYPEALRFFEEAIERRPGHSGAWNGRGLALASLGRLAEARAALEEAVRLRPEFAQAHNNLGIVLHRMNDRTGARSAFESALKIDPGYEGARNNLAKLGAGNASAP